MEINWVKYTKQGKLPLERRNVLVMIEKRQSDEQKRAHEKYGRPGDDPNFKDTAATVAVGYIRVHSGGPFFVVPGVPHKDEDITHWADCLGDDFTAPHWHGPAQQRGEPRRQWNGHSHINAVSLAERLGS